MVWLGGEGGRALVQTGAALALVAGWLAVALLFRRAGFGGAVTRLLILLFGLALNSLSHGWAPVPLFERAFATPPGFAYVPPDRPRVGLVTGLPLVWGEAGPEAVLAGRARTAPILTYLDSQFDMVPLDSIDEAAAAAVDALLVAQPRPLSPAMLAALDAWVRDGGRLLLLVDPDLRWPSDLPGGDPRRPPRDSNLAPLLGHWGLVLEKDAAGAGTRRYQTDGVGRFRADGARCVIHTSDRAECAVGAGRAILVADADLLHARSWAGVGRNGAWDGVGKALRSADTPLFIAEILDELLGRHAIARQRWRVDGIAWIGAGTSPVALWAILLAFPLLVVGIGGIALKTPNTHRVIHSLAG